jgi:hypothetical protein
MLTYGSVFDNFHHGDKKRTPQGLQPTVEKGSLLYPSCCVLDVQTNIPPFSCIFPFKGVLTVFEDVYILLALGKRSGAYPKLFSCHLGFC